MDRLAAPLPRCTRAAPRTSSPLGLGRPDRNAERADTRSKAVASPATARSPPRLRPRNGPNPNRACVPLASWALAAARGSLSVLITHHLELFPVEKISSASMKSATFSVVSWTSMPAPRRQLDRAAARCDAGQKRAVQSRGLDHAVLGHKQVRRTCLRDVAQHVEHRARYRSLETSLPSRSARCWDRGNRPWHRSACFPLTAGETASVIENPLGGVHGKCRDTAEARCLRIRRHGRAADACHPPPNTLAGCRRPLSSGNGLHAIARAETDDRSPPTASVVTGALAGR